MYVANAGDSVVSVIDAHTNKFLMNISLNETSPGEIAFNSNNSNMYVTTGGSKGLAVIRAADNMVARYVTVNDDPSHRLIGIPNAIAFNPKNGNMYVPTTVYHYNSNNNLDGNCLRNVTITCAVSVIDSRNNQIIKNIPVGRGVEAAPTIIAFDPINGNMYVGNERARSVSVIDSRNNQVIKTVPLTGTPSAIAFNPNNGNMYVAGGFSSNAIAFNPKNGNMYVTIGFSDVVSVIDSTSNQLVDSVPVREGALKVAFDPINGNMYVTNALNNTISIIGSSKP